jgi:acyl-CoA synthetase (AMP-forming)/AMP-acid ligase II
MTPALPIPALRGAPSRVAVVCDDGSFSYARLEAEQAAVRETLRKSGARQVLLHAEQTFAAYAALLASAEAGIPTILLPPEPSPTVSQLVAETIGADTVIRHGTATPAAGGVRRRLEPGSVVLVTSGTTGTPKLVGHSWATLAHAVRVRPELDASIWLLAYPYQLYAGLQVVLHVRLNGGTAVCCRKAASPTRSCGAWPMRTSASCRPRRRSSAVCCCSAHPRPARARGCRKSRSAANA